VNHHRIAGSGVLIGGFGGACGAVRAGRAAGWEARLVEGGRLVVGGSEHRSQWQNRVAASAVL